MQPITKYCPSCDTIKPISKFNTHKSGKQVGKPIGYCKTCDSLKSSNWAKQHLGYVKTRSKTWYDSHKKESAIKYTQHRLSHPEKHHTSSENTSCTLYLGYHISETVLSHEFKNIKRMPSNHPGYDFECNRHFKIDVKSSCELHTKSGGTYWQFTIKRNSIPHFFLCIAWDNRVDLNPVHIWLIPAKLINTKTIIAISNTKKSLKKWSKYERPLTNVIDCCRTLRAKKLLEEDVEEVFKI